MQAPPPAKKRVLFEAPQEAPEPTALDQPPEPVTQEPELAQESSEEPPDSVGEQAIDAMLPDSEDPTDPADPADPAPQPMDIEDSDEEV